MATWEEIRAHVRSRYVLVVDEADWIGMEWTFTHQGDTIRQRVKLERSASDDSDWVLVVAAVCRAEKLDTAAALRFNARLAIGSLAIDGDMCHLRAVLPIDTLVFRDLDRAIAFLAREAARLRDPREPRGSGAILFAHYKD